MKKLLRMYLDENITENRLNEKFDYNFNNKSNYDEFNMEYKKFLGVYSCVFYSDNRFLTSFNSYEIRLNINDIEQIIKLLLYSVEKNLENEKYILVDFLYTYYKTIISNDYKQNYSKYKDSRIDFEFILNKYEYKKFFFTKVIDFLYEFYKKLVVYAFENKIFIDYEIINRIFNNLKENKEYTNDIINIFIINNSNLYSIIKYDNEIEKHIETYFNYILDSLDELGGYNYAKEMLYELDKSGILNNELTKQVINKYVKIVNEICTKIKSDESNFVKELSNIDILKNELNYIKKNIKILTEQEKDKILECVKMILYMKRKMIADEEYINKSMHEFTYKCQVSREKVDIYRKELKNNEVLLYNASKLNLDVEIPEALKFYSRSPLLHLVSRYEIDSDKEIYAIGVENRRKKLNDNFKKYVDEKGKKYTELNKDVLLNKLNKDYYEQFLKYLSNTFISHQNILIATIGYKEFEKIIEKLKNSVNYNYMNEYAMLVNNILAIESDIIIFMKQKGMQPKKNGFDNLNDLAEQYKDDKRVMDGLMYLNYILYEKSGLNLRNYSMHGMLINTNIDVPLLVTFSGLIFVSWLLEKK